MKEYLSKVLVVVCILLAVALTLVKRSDNAQLSTANDSITDFSNQLTTAHGKILMRDDNLLSLSNNLADIQSAFLVLSNRLNQTLTMQTEQITTLKGQVATAASENAALNRSNTDLTNQVEVLTTRVAETEALLSRANTNLAQLNKDYALLQNRFLRDVAERVVLARRFNTLAEVKAQLQKLKTNPDPWATPESIYASLNVEVTSNGSAHVIASE